MRKISKIAGMTIALLVVTFGLVAAVEITSTKVTVPPTVDGKVDDVWKTAVEAKIPVAGGLIGSVEVSLKSVYTDTHIYFLAQWSDPTESLNRMWEFNGTAWNKIKGSEDRLGVQWNINAQNFEQLGCTATCHTERHQTKAKGEAVDLWHWKAQRTNPIGQVDDQVIYSAEEGKRSNDKKESGGDSANEAADKKKPKFAFKSTPSDIRILIKDNALEISDYGVFKVGDRVPAEILERFVGSRGDVEANGVWKDGKWTLELGRKLNTGNSDDVQFDVKKTYSFGLSVFDNTGDEKHSTSEVNVLKLVEQKPVAPIAAAPTPTPAKGICGPAALLAIATLPLALYARRKQ